MFYWYVKVCKCAKIYLKNTSLLFVYTFIIKLHVYVLPLYWYPCLRMYPISTSECYLNPRICTFASFCTPLLRLLAYENITPSLRQPWSTNSSLICKYHMLLIKSWLLKLCREPTFCHCEIISLPVKWSALIRHWFDYQDTIIEIRRW